MKNESAKLLLVFVAISMIIGSSCYVINAKGQGFVIPPSPPIKVWIDASPNPAYLGEDIQFRIAVFSEELVDEKITIGAAMGSRLTHAFVFMIPHEEKIPYNRTALRNGEFLIKVTGGYSAECYITTTITVIERKYSGLVTEETFHFYNHSRPPDKPYLLLKKSIEKGEGLIEGVTVEVENIGSGNAKNVEIKDSLPSSFALVSGSVTQKYNSIRQGEHKTFKYTILPLEDGPFILDSATATYEDMKGNSYSSTSNPFMLNVGPPTPTPTQPAPTAPVVPSSTLSPTPSPIEQIPTPTPIPPTPPPDDGNNSWIFLVIAVVAGIVVLLSIKPILIAYYTRKMNNWEREGYDVSKLKEVLKR